jgi:hypothetical protein
MMSNLNITLLVLLGMLTVFQWGTVVYEMFWNPKPSERIVTNKSMLALFIIPGGPILYLIYTIISMWRLGTRLKIMKWNFRFWKKCMKVNDE